MHSWCCCCDCANTPLFVHLHLLLGQGRWCWWWTLVIKWLPRPFDDCELLYSTMMAQSVSGGSLFQHRNWSNKVLWLCFVPGSPACWCFWDARKKCSQPAHPAPSLHTGVTEEPKAKECCVSQTQNRPEKSSSWWFFSSKIRRIQPAPNSRTNAVAGRLKPHRLHGKTRFTAKYHTYPHTLQFQSHDFHQSPTYWQLLFIDKYCRVLNLELLHGTYVFLMFCAAINKMNMISQSWKDWSLVTPKKLSNR